MERRSFLIGAASAILTPAFYRDIVRHIDIRSSPLLVTPERVTRTLFAVRYGNGFTLWLDNHPDDEPNWSMSAAEFYQLQWGGSAEEAIQGIAHEKGLEPEEATELANEAVDQDELLDWHYSNELGSGLAVRYFRDIELGPAFTSGAGRGEVSFCDYRCYGPDRWRAEAADFLSLSLLQARLIELDAGLEVKISKSIIFGT